MVRVAGLALVRPGRRGRAQERKESGLGHRLGKKSMHEVFAPPFVPVSFAMRCDAVQAKALERGELRPGALIPVEALQGCLFPCASSSSSSTPLFASSILAPRSGRPLDRFVGVTDQQVLELEAHRTRMNQVRFRGCERVLLHVGMSGITDCKAERC